MRKLLIAAVLCLIGVCAPATAETRISLRGYDFANSRDVVQLHDVLARAARNFCADSGVRSLEERRFERECQVAFMEEAVGKISRPTVTAFYGALNSRQRIATLGDRAPQQALVALAAAIPQTGVIRAAASE
jgi:UrcA family protein